MSDKPPLPPRTFPWLLVLSLVGLDYFSTLAYLPSIAVQAAGPLAPLAALGVVFVTLVAALPVYFYVVGRSSHGEGATGLLEKNVRGWFGKFLILVLLGFVATDFVITRTLSLADAALHILHNPYWQDHVDWMLRNKEPVRASLPALLQGKFFDFWDEQLVLTLVLSTAGFAFYSFLQTRMTGALLKLAAIVVAIYLLLTAFVLACGLVQLAQRAELFDDWWSSAFQAVPQKSLLGPYAWLALLALYFFPRVALGISGFELSMAIAPLVRGRDTDTPAEPTYRVRDTRKVIVAAALIMAVFIPLSTLIVTLFVPGEEMAEGGRAANRALAYIAHGEGETGVLCDWFGPVFGTIYDVSAASILALAGASAILGIRDLVPGFLARFGMQLEWARKIGVIIHLFNVVILLVTVYFKASVPAQQGAYATSVLALLSGAGAAAFLDVKHRWHASSLRMVVAAPFLLLFFFFLGLTAWTAYRNRAGLNIALAFIGVVLVTSLVSRYIRNKELRFRAFAFTDEFSQARWEEIRQLEFQVLVPHRTGHTSIPKKEEEVRTRHRLDRDVPIIFIEATLGDVSEFHQSPLMQIVHEGDREVIRISRCASIPHVIAAVALEFTTVGRPPEIIFGWSVESPVTANLSFLFLGQGNVPWMVHELIRHAEPDPAKRPQVLIG